LNLRDPRLAELAGIVSAADCALTAAVSSKGKDAHGHLIPDMNRTLARVLKRLGKAGWLAEQLAFELENSTQPQNPGAEMPGQQSA
jgi:hypothetical protein